MSGAVIWGLLAGLATIGLSEAVLRFWQRRPLEAVWKLSLIGALLRTIWILAVLSAVLISGWLDRAAFTLALLAGYLLAQVVAGLRYGRFVGTK